MKTLFAAMALGASMSGVAACAPADPEERPGAQAEGSGDAGEQAANQIGTRADDPDLAEDGADADADQEPDSNADVGRANTETTADNLDGKAEYLPQ